MNKNSTFFLIAGILGIVFGIIYILTLVGIIVAIPLFIGASKFFKWQKSSDEEVLADKDSVVVWAIVFSIFLFPLGLIALVPVFNMEGQISQVITPKSVEKEMDEKMDKIKKLHQMKEDGIITEEDFKLAKEKILSE